MNLSLFKLWVLGIVSQVTKLTALSILNFVSDARFPDILQLFFISTELSECKIFSKGHT